jgi:tetratricopeptide (TPR) repeat protein
MADCLYLLADILRVKGDLAGTAEMLRPALALKAKLLAGDHPTVTTILLNLAWTLEAKGDLARAEEVLREAPAMKRKVVGDHHADVVHRLAQLVERRNDARSAMELFQKSLDLRRAALGSPDAKVAAALTCLAVAQEKAGEIALARASHEEVIAMLRRLFRGDTRLADGLALFGLFLLDHEQHAEAEPILRECLQIRTARIPNDSLRYNAMSLLGGSLLGQGRLDEAKPLLVEGYEKMAQDFAAVRRRQALERIVSLYETWGRHEEARSWKARLAAAKEGEGR